MLEKLWWIDYWIFFTKPHQHQKNNIEDWTNESIENIKDNSYVSINSTLGIIMTINYFSMELFYERRLWDVLLRTMDPTRKINKILNEYDIQKH
jgi:hypothetical protein